MLLQFSKSVIAAKAGIQAQLHLDRRRSCGASACVEQCRPRRKNSYRDPQANLNYLSIHVADARGFFKDEGLDNETVVISGPLSIAALLSGDVDFSGASGSGMRAALKGAPLKGIYFQ